MPLPEPKPGLVIRYDYLWTREAAAGRDQGKERPACLVAATDPAASPRFVVILPITHAPPDEDTVGVEIPVKVRAALGPGDLWGVLSEVLRPFQEFGQGDLLLCSPHLVGARTRRNQLCLLGTG